jgi:hypothetical protein
MADETNIVQDEEVTEPRPDEATPEVFDGNLEDTLATGATGVADPAPQELQPTTFVEGQGRPEVPSIRDEDAQVFIDGGTLSQMLQSMRERLAAHKIEHAMVKAGVRIQLPDGRGKHLEQILKQVVEDRLAISVLAGLWEQVMHDGVAVEEPGQPTIEVPQNAAQLAEQLKRFTG